jgi:hypothetical protein
LATLAQVPKLGCISEIHLAFATFVDATHPSSDIAKVCRLNRINHCAAQLDPFEHLKTLRYFQQMRGFDDTGPGRNEPQSTHRLFLHDRQAVRSISRVREPRTHGRTPRVFLLLMQRQLPIENFLAK